MPASWSVKLTYHPCFLDADLRNAAEQQLTQAAENNFVSLHREFGGRWGSEASSPPVSGLEH